MDNIIVGNRIIGEGHPCFIVAEISANHNQELERAKELIRLAKEAGADAVKLQTYTADTLTIDSQEEWFQITKNKLWAGKTLYQLYQEAYTPWEWHAELFETAKQAGLICFSTPFDLGAIQFLEKLDTPLYKVASFEVVDLPLLEQIGKTGKPVIMSTGMASLSEIDAAVRTLRQSGAGPLAVLKCTSAYPALPEWMNIKTITHLKSAFNVIPGLSDHTLSSAVAVAAVALGALVIEKHFTLARADGGADAAFSLEPEEFARMVSDIRLAEKALGNISYEITPEEKANLRFRRSLFVVEDIQAGESLTEKNIRSIRPGFGLEPKYFSIIQGKKVNRAIKRGTPLSWEMIGE